MSNDQALGLNATPTPEKRQTVREQLERAIKYAVDSAAQSQKALMTLPPEILDADADAMAKVGVYFHVSDPC